VDWDSGTVQLLTETTPWPDLDRPRRAAVSSFGVSGTNAHVVLEHHGEHAEENPTAVPPGEAGRPVAWLLSGATPGGLRGQVDRLYDHVSARPELSAEQVGRALTTRSALRHRLAVTGGTREELLSRLHTWRTDPAAATDPAIAAGTPAGAATAAYLFPGQGAQRPGMGAGLYAAFPVFATRLDEVCAEFDRHLDRPLRPLLFTADAESLNRTCYTQPALFAVGVALAAQLEAVGVTPSHLIGHSIGELTAAHVAGVLDLPSACALVAARGALMQALPPGGAMAAVQANEREVLESLPGQTDDIAIAALNSPTTTVVSGTEAAVSSIAETWTERGRRVKRLAVSHAFHSPLLDGMLDDFREIASSMTYRPPRIPVVSNIEGRVLSAEELCTPEYWVRHARRPVRFADGVRHLADAGVTVFLELGPDGGLTSLVQESLPDGTKDPVTVPLMHRALPESQALLAGLGRAWRRGVDVDRGELLGTERLELPTYAFDRRRFWLNATVRSTEPTEAEPQLPPAAEQDTTWAGRLAELPRAERADAVLETVRSHAARVLGHGHTSEIDPERGFLDAGFDSLTAVEFRNGLSLITGLPLPATLIFDHPTPADLADWIVAEGALDTVRTVRTWSGEPIAIVGLACRYPGGVRSPEDLWRVVADGVDATSEFP
ncbi:acyltransferase domain-containing protein, partial [Streptomyces sp. NPDC047072]|uniref:acyltransferase domain-containing protein n=1 Tax=Streptomyces sp. NPDC047072 TaxID=3154809 RepID=UPI0033CCA3B1